MALATLGTTIVFEVSANKLLTWSKSRRTQSPRWHTHDVYGGKPVAEFIGPGLDGYSMSIRLDINKGVDPTDQLNKIRKAEKAGTVLQLVIGGTLVANFYISGTDEEFLRYGRDGTLVLAELGLSLMEYN